MRKISESDERRFWAKVDKSGDCWMWLASTNRHGYGQMSLGGRKGKPELAHRIAYAISGGGFEGTLHICHRCDNPRCVNPTHLFSGSQADNIADAMDKGRMIKGERCARAKITEQEVKEIRASTATQRELAALYKLDQSNISYIQSRKTWGHV